jgi:PGDYG protein
MDTIWTTIRGCILGALIVLNAAGCGGREEKAVSKSPNAEILDEVAHAKMWFHAKRVRPIWAKEIDKDQTVETIEGPTKAKAGDYLCRGEAGEFWAQSAKQITERYDKTDEVDAGGWRKFTPRPDNQGVLAAQVNHAFSVHAKWGVLAGKSGDYVLKNFTDRDVSYPDDVWVVDQKLFQLTYQAVEHAK